MKPLDKYVIDVDMRSNEHVKFGDIELYRPHIEGDSYGSKPFHGTVAYVPRNGSIPHGATVFMHHHAIDTYMLLDGRHVYIVEPELIVAYEVDGETFAHNTLILEPVEDEPLKSSLLEIVTLKKPPITKGGILYSGWEGFNKGDLIEHRPGANWEFLIKQQPHFYISKKEYVYRKNGELLDQWCLVEKHVQMNTFGIDVSKNWWIVKEGRYAGEMVYAPSKPIKGCYLMVENIQATLSSQRITLPPSY